MFEDLVGRLGTGRVAIGTAVPVRYRLDALRAHRGSRLPDAGLSPAAVVWPRSADEVAAVVRFARAAGLSVVPWGGGTGLMGGARPGPDSLVIDLRRMRRVRRIDPISCPATVEAGVVPEELDPRPPKRRLSLRPCPPSPPRAHLRGPDGAQ